VTRAALFAAAAVLFAIAATANSGGYRYGVSDQAFYATAVVKDLHPSFFPRDSGLIATQAKLMWADEMVAGLVRVTGLDLPALSLVLYALTLLLLFGGAVWFARAMGYSWWAVAALLLLLTFRHRIAKTGANSLEGYMHPRMLAFGLGVFALVATLRRRAGWTAVWLIAAACWHPTTAFWFAIVASTAFVTARVQWRRSMWIAGGLAVVAAVWLVSVGPLAGRLVRMDAAWVAVLAEKDYLFPHEWPTYAWIANLSYPLVIVTTFRYRDRLRIAAESERSLLTGLLALVAVFLAVLPLTVVRVALAVQSQTTRVFWLLDFIVAGYVAWWLMDAASPTRLRRIAVFSLLAALSIARGAYLIAGPESDRRLVALGLPSTPWADAMAWLRAQPPATYVLADPGHAWKYGVSVRLAAEKDTVLEAGKDTALALYDRDVAMEVARRQVALRDFDQLTAGDVRRLHAQYAFDAMVAERSRTFDLPMLYSNAQFVIYGLR
jgi:hypothetical protein